MFSKRRSKVDISKGKSTKRWPWKSHNVLTDDEPSKTNKGCPELAMISADLVDEGAAQARILQNILDDVPSATTDPVGVAEEERSLHHDGYLEPLNLNQSETTRVERSNEIAAAAADDDVEKMSANRSEVIKNSEDPMKSTTVGDTIADYDQEEGEQFSLKCITQLTTMMGSIEEDVSEEPYVSLASTATLGAPPSTTTKPHEADASDFVKLEKAEVDSNYDVFASQIKAADNVTPRLKEAMTDSPVDDKSFAPLTTTTTTTTRKDERPAAAEPLINFSEEAAAAPHMESVAHKSNEASSQELPSVPVAFGKPSLLQPLKENSYGEDKFPDEPNYSDEEPDTYVGSKAMMDAIRPGGSYDTFMEKLEGVIPIKPVQAATTVKPPEPPLVTEKTFERLRTDGEKSPRGDPWISDKGVDKNIRGLLLWEEPIRSGLTLALIVLFLSSLYFCNLICIASYAALLVMLIGCALHLTERLKCHGDAADVKSKLHETLSCELPSARIHAQVDVALDAVRYAIDSTRRALSGHPQELARVLTVIGVLYVLGSAFTALELCLLGTLLAFSVPFAVKKYDKEIRRFADQAAAKLKLLGDRVPLLGGLLRKAKSS